MAACRLSVVTSATAGRLGEAEGTAAGPNSTRALRSLRERSGAVLSVSSASSASLEAGERVSLCEWGQDLVVKVQFRVPVA